MLEVILLIVLFALVGVDSILSSLKLSSGFALANYVMNDDEEQQRSGQSKSQLTVVSCEDSTLSLLMISNNLFKHGHCHHHFSS